MCPAHPPPDLLLMIIDQERTIAKSGQIPHAAGGQVQRVLGRPSYREYS